MREKIYEEIDWWNFLILENRLDIIDRNTDLIFAVKLKSNIYFALVINSNSSTLNSILLNLTQLSEEWEWLLEFPTTTEKKSPFKKC